MKGEIAMTMNSEIKIRQQSEDEKILDENYWLYLFQIIPSEKGIQNYETYNSLLAQNRD